MVGMTAPMPMRAPPKVGDDFLTTSTTPNQTAPTIGSRDGPAVDVRGMTPPKPKTTAKQAATKVPKGKTKTPPAKSPKTSNKMPMKTIQAMKSTLSMGKF